jgi:hypothetical protein
MSLVTAKTYLITLLVYILKYINKLTELPPKIIPSLKQRWDLGVYGVNEPNKI